MRGLLREQGLEDAVEIDSAGTGDWHVGTRPTGARPRRRGRAGSCSTARPGRSRPPTSPTST